MNSAIPAKSEIVLLERELNAHSDRSQRLVILDQLVNHYAYTNVLRASEILKEQAAIFEEYNFPDFYLNYLIHASFVENQLYHFENAARFCEKAIELVGERGDVQQQAAVYIDYTGICINLNKMEVASDYLEKANKLLKVFPEQKLQARILCREGYIYLHYSNYSKAIEAFLEADKMLKALESPPTYMDYYFITLIYSGLGKVYEQNNEWEKSVKAYLRVAEMCERLEMRTRLSWHYLNVGSGFMALNDEENAELYYQKAIEVQDDSSQLARASALANLGYIAFQQQAYEKALDRYDRAEELYKEVKASDYYNFSNIERWRAHLYLELKQDEDAMHHFAMAFDYAKQIDDYKQLSGICKDIANYYAQLEDYKNAYEYQVLHDQYAEGYVEQVNMRKVLELEVKYEAEQKKKEAELLRLQATKLQLKALRAQMNPHFMYNSLNAIQHYITSNEIKNAAKYLAKFAKLMRQSLEYSELEIISLEKEMEFLEDYLAINQKLRFEDRLKYEISVDDEIEEDILGVPTMIVQPYVENAIEHGLRSRQNGKIRISFFLIDELTILCIVEDNGIGRDAARKQQQKDGLLENHKSRGTSITEKRLEILHQSKDRQFFVKTVDLTDDNTGEARGTRVEIQIPIVEIQMVSKCK